MRILSWKSIKIICVILFSMLLLLNLVGCSPLVASRLKTYFDCRHFEKCAPGNHPNSVWATENGEISFHVEESKTSRYEGTILNQNGEVIKCSPVQTNMFGEINKDGEKYDIFIIYGGGAAPTYIDFISEALPTYGETGMYNVDIVKYTLVTFETRYINDHHFEATVATSEIFKEGTIFNFHRIEN